MHKTSITIEEVKQKIAALKGVAVRISVNKGRKRIVKYDGEVLETYPSVFTLKIKGDKNLEMLSCSYSDVVCGDIALKAADVTSRA